MKHQLLTFVWRCDCCKSSVKTYGTWVNDSRPNGWETFSFEPSFAAGATYDFCPDCLEEAELNHKDTEDNHYGLILRRRKAIAKYKLENPSVDGPHEV